MPGIISKKNNFLENIFSPQSSLEFIGFIAIGVTTNLVSNIFAKWDVVGVFGVSFLYIYWRLIEVRRAKKLSKALTKPSDEVTKLFSGSGGINHKEEDRGKIEAIVLFTSKEVINRELKAFSYEGCDNPGSVRDEIIKNLKKVWRRSDKDEGRKVFWCEVDIDNFQDCFNKVVLLAHRFSPDGKQGKEIWCNLTGGSNSIGYALLSMAGLTGKSAKHFGSFVHSVLNFELKSIISFKITAYRYL